MVVTRLRVHRKYDEVSDRKDKTDDEKAKTWTYTKTNSKNQAYCEMQVECLPMWIQKK